MKLVQSENELAIIMYWQAQNVNTGCVVFS